MTGSGAGGIDYEWLIDNLRTTKISSGSDAEDGEQPTEMITTFCFAEKAAQAAEAFILARYHLPQVYFHHTTRGFQQVLAEFLKRLAAIVHEKKLGTVCLPPDHPLAVYYAADPPSVDHYLALDDTSVWSAIEAATRGADAEIQDLAVRLRDRRRLKAIEIATVNPTSIDKARHQFIQANLSSEIGKTIFVDRAPLMVYDSSRPNFNTIKIESF